MARQNNRLVLNRAALDAITLGTADGLLALADAVIAATKVPDAPVLGAGLIAEGGTVAYVLGKKVGGTAKKPSAMKVRKMGVAVAGGFPFPARFAEIGTVNQPARPFLTPALMSTVGDAGPYIAAAVARRLATVSERSDVSAAIKARAVK